MQSVHFFHDERQEQTLNQVARTIGFIGAGRMATALGRGCTGAPQLPNWQVLAADPSAVACEQFAQQIPGAQILADNKQLLSETNLVVLAVKPQVMSDVLADLAEQATDEHLFISIAAGITLAKLSDWLPHGKLVRVMPNTPCLIGCGASCYSLGRGATESDAQVVDRMLCSVGTANRVDEPWLDAVTGLSGSGPAFVYTMIEALAAGGVEMGLPPDLALQLATQTTRGAAEMVQNTALAPAELREQVTSPGGTTLAGLEKLAAANGAAAFQAAVVAATQRSVELGAMSD